MSTSKADELKKRFGDSLADSVGLRDGADTVPMAEPVADSPAPPIANFIHDRSVGDIDIDLVMINCIFLTRSRSKGQT